MIPCLHDHAITNLRPSGLSAQTMTSDAGLESHLKNLRAALLKLHPTGPEGFEGLIATLLTSITSIPFRLASSGSQFGVDGQAIYPPDGVSFEAKRYDSSIRKESILAKLQEIVSERGRATELWVLGASCQVSTQITGYLEDFESREGIGTLILDWDETSVSPLAAALAMADLAAA